MAEKRLIDANALMFDVMGLTIVSPEAMNYANAVAVAIEDAPTIDAVEVVHGRWILGVPVTCSVCGKPAAEHDSPIAFWESPYCPWCGAKMDGGEEGV